MLPARQGDCLWIEYGDAKNPNRVLIDGGTPGTYPVLQQRLTSLPLDQRRFELMIVTHIDSDHIGGTLPLLIDDDCEATFDDIWFNGWRHLPGSGLEEFGPVQGEKLTTRLSKGDLSWNQAFDSKPVRFSKTDPLPVYDLPGGMRLTLLSPGADELKRLRPVWKKECEAAGLVPGQAPSSSHPVPPGFEVMGPVNINQLALSDYSSDESPANGSSIAVLAEFEGKRILLAGDAHAEVLLKRIERLSTDRNRLRLDAFKLPHHGSKHNLSRELLDKLDCQRYLFSTDGTQFKHPDRQAAARVIKFGGPHPELLFNYRSKHNEIWDNAQWMMQYGYSATHPGEGQEGLMVNL
jgi:hypothetical protein